MIFDPKRFGRRLKELREAAVDGGMSQQRLAEAAGLSQRAVSQWERGDREPLWSNVLSLAKALGVDVHAFIDGNRGGAVRRGRPSSRGKATDGDAAKKPAAKRVKGK